MQFGIALASWCASGWPASRCRGAAEGADDGAVLVFMPVQMPILLGDLYCICVGYCCLRSAAWMPDSPPLPLPATRRSLRPGLASGARLRVGAAWGGAVRADHPDDAAGRRHGAGARTAAQLCGPGPRGGGGLVLGGLPAGGGAPPGRRGRTGLAGADLPGRGVWLPAVAGPGRLREVDATHAAVVTGVLPMATAALAAAFLAARQLGLWLSAWLGWGWCWPCCVAWRGWLECGRRFAVCRRAPWRGGLCGVAASWRGACRAQQVICWVLVLALPLTVPSAALSWRSSLPLSRPGRALPMCRWCRCGWAFCLVPGAGLGGTLRISQVRLQPFLSMLFAVPCWASRSRLAAWPLLRRWWRWSGGADGRPCKEDRRDDALAV